MADTTNDRPVNRRGFFRDGLASLLGPLADMLEKRLDDVRQSFQGFEPEPRLLRPPGALPEADFLRTCQSCGKCVTACPVGAIFLTRQDGRGDLSRYGGGQGVGEGGRAGQPLAELTPVINPAVQPCTVCGGLSCMAACPSGALTRTPADRIHMGTAGWLADHCLRTRGEDCRRCTDECPRGERAIHLGEQAEPSACPPVIVESGGCVGCGVCENVCPTDPKAITVWPNR